MGGEKQKLTRNLFDRSILWIATIPLCDKSRLHNVNAAKLVSDMIGIFVNMLCDKSNLNHNPGKIVTMRRIQTNGKFPFLVETRQNDERIKM